MEPLALYIHWPFCLAKCPYCDFNSHVRERIDQARFAAALRSELAWEAARLGRRPLVSIFFGGGTPSLMDPGTAAALIADATGLFAPVPDLEITLEANPTSVEAARLRAFRDAGVNRLSLGVQALDDASLATLGRKHSAAEALAALETARALFPRLSFDLICARPHQTETAWRAELGTALALAADHLSLYQLTIEPGTAFEALHRQGRLVLPDEATAAALYDATAEEAARFGLAAYEVSNYALPGAECRHNLQYWRYGDYVGIGPGAHGRLSLGGGFACHPPPPRARAVGRARRAPGPRQHRGNAPRRHGACPRGAADGPASHRGHRRRPLREPHRGRAHRRPRPRHAPPRPGGRLPRARCQPPARDARGPPAAGCPPGGAHPIALFIGLPPPSRRSCVLPSLVCRHEHFRSEWMLRWERALRDDPAVPNPWMNPPHRKLWEWCAIAQALEERDMLRPGRRGCGFAVGSEPLPSAFAARGAIILASDGPDAAAHWGSSGEHAGSLDAVHHPGIIDRTAFAARVSFRFIDMRRIEGVEPGSFDFVWSSCAFEHLGTLAAGLDFAAASLGLLRPGGVAVHTTEFNVSSNDRTSETGENVIYRRRDLEAFAGRVRLAGAALVKPDFDPGSEPEDVAFDLPPYYVHHRPHVKLLLQGHVSTSIMLVLHQGPPTPASFLQPPPPPPPPSLRSRLWRRLSRS